MKNRMKTVLRFSYSLVIILFLVNFNTSIICIQSNNDNYKNPMSLNMDTFELEKVSDYHDGEAYEVMVAGSIAYLTYTYGGLLILNISDLNNIEKLGEFDDGGFAQGVFVSDNYAYVAEYGDGFEILDVSDPTNPVKLSQFFDGGQARHIYIEGDYAYIADGSNGGFEIVNVSDPMNPYKVGYYLESFSSAEDISIVGEYAYVAYGSYGLEIIDISDKANPTLVSQFNDGGTTYDIYVENDYAYVLDAAEGLEIIDISNKTDPQEVGQFDRTTTNSPRDIHVENGIAYVGFSDDLKILNVSNPSTPEEIGTYPLTGNGFYSGVFYTNNFVYLANPDHGLECINVIDKANPIKEGSFDCDTSEVYDLHVLGNYAYIATQSKGMRILDISDKSSPINISQYNPGSSANDVFVSGNIAYVDFGEIQIVNVSNPLIPVQLGVYNENPNDIYVSGNVIYATFGSGGLHIIDVTDPTVPTKIGNYTDGDNAQCVFANGNYAYVGYGSGQGFKILDISNPSLPYFVGEYGGGPPFYKWINDVQVIGSIAYLAVDMYGFEIVNITDPSNPQLIARETPDIGVFVEGSYAYLLTHHSGLEMCDISDLSNPIIVGEFDDGGSGWGEIFYDNNYIYVANVNDGFEIILIKLDSTGPTISNIKHNPVSPTSEDSINVSAEVIDPSGVVSAHIIFKNNTDIWNSHNMTFLENSTYFYTLEPFPVGEQITYYISAFDNSSNKNYAFNDNEGNYYSFSIQAVIHEIGKIELLIVSATLIVTISGVFFKRKRKLDK